MKKVKLQVVLCFVLAAGCGSSLPRPVRPTHATFNRDERSEVWERSLRATVAEGGERVLVSDRENGVITTPVSTLLLSPSGALTYVTPRVLPPEEAAETERVNFLWVNRVLLNNPAAANDPVPPERTASGGYIGLAIAGGLAATATAAILAYAISSP